MLKELLNYLEDKNIVILGFGKQGKSTYKFLRKYFPEKRIDIMDENFKLLELNPELGEDIYCEVILGKLDIELLDKYDLIVKAPGISLKDYNLENIINKITSQYELFLKYFNVTTIGITGTKGKSTTSSLINRVLLENDKKSLLLENIGVPIFDDIEEIDEETIAVLEVSSHTLEFAKASPNISIMLNAYEEHLDHYKSFEAYVKAKFNIAKFQNENDYFIYNYDNENMKKINFEYKSSDIPVSIEDVENLKKSNCKNIIYIENEHIYYNDEKMLDINTEMNLKGMHNINNIMFVIGVAKILNLDIPKTINAICSFHPLEHRLEFVAKIDGVEYYNDSIATVPEATMNGIRALKNVNTIIIGGKDRGVSLDELIEFLKNSEVENIICIHTTGKNIYETLLNSNKNVFYYDELKDAVDKAKEVTKKETICLLTPAATSYGFFKNFEERGKLFKKYVLE